MSRVMARTWSGVFLIWYFRWIGLVEMNVWMRGTSACRTASQHTRTSCSMARARPAMREPFTSRAISATDSKSPFEAIGKAGLDDVDAHARELLGDLELLGLVHGGAGRLLAVAQRGVEDLDVARAGAGAGRRSGLRAPVGDGRVSHVAHSSTGSGDATAPLNLAVR